MVDLDVLYFSDDEGSEDEEEQNETYEVNSFKPGIPFMGHRQTE